VNEKILKRDVFILVRGVVIMAAVMTLLMTAALAVDLRGFGVPFSQMSSFNVAEARHLSNALNRNFNQLVGVVFTTVAIAVPLTANMYSLKFLEFFIKDPINAAALTLVVFSNLNNLWAAYALKDNFIPVFQLHLALILLIICFSMLFPYLYYVFRFLHPNTLLERLEAEIIADLRAASRFPHRTAAYRRQVAEGIEHIANIAIRSIDRADRNTAIESVLTLERVARSYCSFKTRLPPVWFRAEQNFFLGFSSQAVDEFSESRSWMEMKLFSQLRQVLSAAIPRVHDVVSTIAKTLRKLGLETANRRETTLRELVMEYFNTFIRLAITRKDPRAVFTLFDQYRTYAEALNVDDPDLVLEIAYYFEYYGQLARDHGLNFIVEAVAHDLGSLVRHVWEAGMPNRDGLLEHFLRYDSRAKAPLPGVKKAQAILASYFLLTDQPEPAALIRQSFLGLDPVFVTGVREDLLQIKREKYWEVNDRRMNIDYVPDAQRVKLQEFFESLLALETSFG
jgi:hypothetical protein